MKNKKTPPDTQKEVYRCMTPCSAQDCTGLIPNGPVDEADLENYSELYPFLPHVPDAPKSRASSRHMSAGSSHAPTT